MTLIRSIRLQTERRPTRGLEVGDGSDMLVWFPALLDSAAGFGRAMLALRRKLPESVRVLAIDPPGYGEGIDGDDTLLPIASWDHWCESLVHALKAHGAGRIVFVGNSSGGVAATLAAAAAQRCAGLVLACWCDWRGTASPDASVLCPRDRDGVQRLLSRAWYEPPALAPAALAHLLAQSRRPQFVEHVGSFDPIVYRERLAAFAGSLALIGGEHDGLVPLAALRETARARPGTQLQVVPSCGHYPHRERTQELASVLAAVTRRLLDTDDRLRDRSSTHHALHGGEHGTELEH